MTISLQVYQMKKKTQTNKQELSIHDHMGIAIFVFPENLNMPLRIYNYLFFLHTKLISWSCSTTIVQNQSLNYLC